MILPFYCPLKAVDNSYKVKQARCLGVLLESKPVSYSWFPAQVGPLYSLPLADFLENSKEITI